ncbi:MAG TPA: helix-hairpin-helix domain-containing protein [Candidatus Acidoferrum sp.]|nr:helix-hairpin-helix domain-containing protein [Candidatus Acidoferrum sp.]
MPFRSPTLLVFSCVLALSASAGCGWLQSDNRTEEQKREDAQKTRDEVAKATERAKPEIQEAGRELKDAAKTAAEQARAAAQGVKDGWERGRSRKVDLNTASQGELMAIPGITRRDAHRIVAGRPYGSVHDLVGKGVLSEDRYAEIRDWVGVS